MWVVWDCRKLQDAMPTPWIESITARARQLVTTCMLLLRSLADLYAKKAGTPGQHMGGNADGQSRTEPGSSSWPDLLGPQ